MIVEARSNPSNPENFTEASDPVEAYSVSDGHLTFYRDELNSLTEAMAIAACVAIEQAMTNGKPNIYVNLHTGVEDEAEVTLLCVSYETGSYAVKWERYCHAAGRYVDYVPGTDPRLPTPAEKVHHAKVLSDAMAVLCPVNA